MSFLFAFSSGQSACVSSQLPKDLPNLTPHILALWYNNINLLQPNTVNLSAFMLKAQNMQNSEMQW